MSARQIIISAAFSVSICASLLPTTVFGQDAAVPHEAAKQPYLGEVNGGSVFVRSAAREDAYPVMKLDKGTQVTIVGMKGKWLEILPPKDSFAYVPKAWVDRRGTGDVGRASREIISKVGSRLNEMKTNPMGKVEQGQDVKIVGEKDEYYVITPPQGSYLYVSQQFVDPVKPIAAKDVKDSQERAANPSPGVKTNDPTAQKIVDGLLTRKPDSTTQPSEAVADATPPATQPTDAAATLAANTFDQLEIDFKAANERPINEQPIAQLMTGYGDLLTQDALPASMRRIAEIRQATLKFRNEAREEYLATRASQEKAIERRKALEAEREEIQERIKQNEIVTYAAVGTLRTSSIQRGSQLLYRLTDPSSGRTIAYLRTSDPKYAALLGKFVGVKGMVTNDTALNMKMLDQPTEATAIDRDKVNKTITAQIIPPSLLPSVRSASTGGPE